MSLAHIGVSIFILGATISSSWKVELESSLKIGENIILEDKKIFFASMEERIGPNWIASVANIKIEHKNGDISFLQPERRFYPASQMNTSEPAILSKFLYDLYIVLSEQEGQNKAF